MSFQLEFWKILNQILTRAELVGLLKSTVRTRQKLQQQHIVGPSVGFAHTSKIIIPEHREDKYELDLVHVLSLDVLINLSLISIDFVDHKYGCHLGIEPTQV